MPQKGCFESAQRASTAMTVVRGPVPPPTLPPLWSGTSIFVLGQWVL